MAGAIIECVPNFSEGRRQDIIDKIVEPFRTTRGCYLFDHRADADHNRLVVSLAGEPQAVQNALLRSAEIAAAHIDMNSHQGA
ncbi:MAG: glutamate formiminotransferase, partial [Synergistales bacterium]|nr:glutamate formiminotransferase [Synergistales bacterium]